MTDTAHLPDYFEQAHEARIAHPYEPLPHRGPGAILDAHTAGEALYRVVCHIHALEARVMHLESLSCPPCVLCGTAAPNCWDGKWLCHDHFRKVAG
jgi:hypothetical protein